MNIPLFIIGLLFGGFVVYTVYNIRKMKKAPQVPNNDKIKVLTESNFEHQTKQGLTLVDFWAEWCMPCKMVAPILNDLANEIEGKAAIGKLNVEHFQPIAVKYNVRNIPTLILFKDGVEINRFVGVKSKDFLLKQILKS